jgi:hypothetical protein
VIFLCYLKYAGTDKPMNDEYITFTDETQISAYAKEAMQTLHKLGIIQGVGGNAVNPRVQPPEHSWRLCCGGFWSCRYVESSINLQIARSINSMKNHKFNFRR